MINWQTNKNFERTYTAQNWGAIYDRNYALISSLSSRLYDNLQQKRWMRPPSAHGGPHNAVCLRLATPGQLLWGGRPLHTQNSSPKTSRCLPRRRRRSAWELDMGRKSLGSPSNLHGMPLHSAPRAILYPSCQGGIVANATKLGCLLV